ncbi:MAG: helix-turn-helix transcriptional regulator [Clostridia bacterium]|nr:helix-turn-helix transcriptional regulator [Clostridia bacterium]
MTFGEKLKKLRIDKSLTQDELAEKLYVTRTAISKWESDRGYPNIESLKQIAKFFSVTVDELLSSDELLTIAQEDNKQKEKYFRDLVYALLDLSIAMLLFLPFFAQNSYAEVQSVSLIALDGVQPYLKTAYFAVVTATVLMGVLTLCLQNCGLSVWLKSKTLISLVLGISLVLLFMISSQPYAGVFAFVLLVIKTAVLIIRR